MQQSTPTDQTKRKRKNFTEDEDEKLMEAYQVHGANWELIISSAHLERTPRQVSDRYKRLKKGGKAVSGGEEEAGPPISVNLSGKSMPSGAAIRQPTIMEQFAASAGGGNSLQTVSPAAQAASAQMLQTLRREIEDLKRRNLETLEALKTAHERAEDAESDNAVNRKLYKNKLVSELRSHSKGEFEEARREIAMNSLRLGTLKWERHGNQVQEMWQQGTIYEELKLKEAALMVEETTMTALRAETKQKKRAPPAERGGMSKLEFEEQEEIYNIQLAHIRKQMDELKVKFENLQSDLALHRKEIKRVRDEDESRFKSQPLLNDRYILLKLVGKGGFSEVFKAYDLNTMQYVAVKLHQMEPHWPEKKKESYMKHALRELHIQRAVRHPRVVGVYDSFIIDANAWAAVMDFCEGRDLDFYLKLNTTFPEKEAKSIITQVVRALHYLHTRESPVIHFDLKPANILYYKSECRLTDFGLSKVMESSNEFGAAESQMELTSQGAGTYWYLPPECFIQGDGARISPKVDIWSVGVVFFQLVFGKRPFGDNVSQHAILTKNLINPSSVVEFPPKPSISDAARDFITQCLSTDVRARPTAEQLLAHIYLQKTSIPKSKPFKEPAPKTTI